jgi:hypothetical protein
LQRAAVRDLGKEAERRFERRRGRDLGAGGRR